MKDKVSSTTPVSAPYAKGTVVSYVDEGSGVVDTVTADFTVGAVVGYGESDKSINILTSTAAGTPTYHHAKEITDDTKFFWISTKDKKGMVSEGVELANELAVPGAYEMNVFVKENGSTGEVAAIFIDVNNKIDGATTAVEQVNLTGLDSLTPGTIWNTVVVKDSTGAVLDAATETVKLGETITVVATTTTGGAKGFEVKVGGSTVAAVANDTFAAGASQTVTFAATASGAVTFVDKA